MPGQIFRAPAEEAPRPHKVPQGKSLKPPVKLPWERAGWRRLHGPAVRGPNIALLDHQDRQAKAFRADEMARRRA